MPQIEHEASVSAPPAEVFSLISRVEPFVDLCEAVQDIEALGDDRYRWHVRVAGVKLSFEVQVTDIQPPTHFAWESITGVPNRGRYTLTPTADGTRLHFQLHYELKNRLLEKALSGTTRSIVHRLSNEIVGNVERELGKR
ncbi:SRPBCC family protein [Natronospira bacteriovora]|uniref:SRPBCC family protein n=1 Tax=Natronospira bacteriovora TaxID=3069753 RepID=A0ABU0W3M6_9GAMM|nr:SRPBCC family protein [Natronospira sp. AB-CW4]MDQ2068621.1 SRPBCC family protein [Natronospira sp. AB-CW4]